MIYNKLFNYLKDIKEKLKKKKLSQKINLIKIIEPTTNKLYQYYLNIIDKCRLLYNLVVILYANYKLEVYKGDKQEEDYQMIYRT